jgi:hypothetical protein
MAIINNTELLPCPFCGATDQNLWQSCADRGDYRPKHWLSLFCQCGISIDSDDVRSDAYSYDEEMPTDHPVVELMINVWNKRV